MNCYRGTSSIYWPFLLTIENFDIVHEAVNNETHILLEHWNLLLFILMKHGICLSELLGIPLNLRRLVNFLGYSFLDPFAIHARSCDGFLVVTFEFF